VIMMEYGYGRIVENWGHQQTPSPVPWPEISVHQRGTGTRLRGPYCSSGYATSSSYQSISPSQCYAGDGLVIARPDLNSALSEGNTPSPPRHNSHSSSTPSSKILSSQDGVSYGQLRQDYPSPTPGYNVFQQTWSQNNTLIGSPYYNPQRQQQQQQPALWSSQSSLYLIPANSSSSALSFTSLPGPAVKDNAISSPPIHQPKFLPRPEDLKYLAGKQSISEDFPSTCRLCGEIIQDRNVQWVHYWTKHTPTTSSPDAWTPKKCLWKDCRLEKEFMTSRSWVVHVNYVHQKGHKCGVAGCRAKPFGSPADLERHRLTKHAEPIYCPKAGCQARKRMNLRRKDKLDEHEAMWHGQLMCEVPGCPRRRIYGEDHGFSKPSKLEDHKRQKHRHLQILNSSS
jgi:hypothetical protein